MSKKKQLPPPPAVDDLSAAMSRRYDSPTPAATKPREFVPRRTRRSWLLPTEVADALTHAADGIHHRSGGRISKSDAQAALIQAGINHATEVETQLNNQQ